MGNALQDQLLNLGLVDKKQAAQSKKDKYKKNKKVRQQNKPIIDEDKVIIQEQMALKKAQDKQLNQVKNDEANAKAIKAQIRQLIEMNSLNIEKGAIKFNFQDKQVIKRIKVDEAMQQQLINGFLAISKWGNKYHIIPLIVAEKIAQRDDSFIILLNDKNEQDSDIEDEYAEYEIPDDLMW